MAFRDNSKRQGPYISDTIPAGFVDYGQIRANRKLKRKPMDISALNRKSLPEILILSIVLIALVLWGISHFLFFHTFIEMMRVVVAVALCVIAWNTRQYSQNTMLTSLGIAFLFIACIDLLHAFSYKGINLLGNEGANVPTQLWIAARYLEAVAFLVTFVYWRETIHYGKVFFGYFMATVALIYSILIYPVFPDSFIDGQGLTTFKIASEYIITAILGITLYVMHSKRNRINPYLYQNMFYAIILAGAAELAFTLYKDVYGLTNMAGHILKFISVYLLYKAAIVHVLNRPYQTMYDDIVTQRKRLAVNNRRLVEEIYKRENTLHELKDLNQTLHKSQATLHEQLSAVEDKYKNSLRETSEVVLRKADLARDIAKLQQHIFVLRDENAVLRDQVLQYTRLIEQASTDINEMIDINAQDH